jgi:small-conductance mechanosensitive channel/CRP-like cAMP-binding protein
MTTTLSLLLMLLVIIAGLAAMRRFPDRVRIGFDVVGFVAISAFLFMEGAVPVFNGPVVALDWRGLVLRAAGVAWWLMGARIIVAAFRLILCRDQQSRETRLASDLIAAATYLTAVFFVLNSVLVLPIAGLFATSGILAIVLGLALQNTLADVFAGIAVGVEAPFRVGDRIMLGDKIEGRVVQINWRSIRIQTDGDDVAIVPNSIVAKSEILNRSFPTPRRASSVELSCIQSAPPERVLDMLRQATWLCPAVLQTPPPVAVLSRLGVTRNFYTINFFVADAAQLMSTKSQLLRHAHRQLHYAGFFERRQKGDQPVPLSGHEIPMPLSGREILAKLVVFDALAPAQLDELAQHLQSETLDAGQVLFKQGAKDATLYIIASGIVNMTRETETGVKESIGYIGAGDYIGEISLLTGTPHAATASAKSHCEIYKLSRDAIAPLLANNEELVAAFDRSVRRGLDLLNREVAVRSTPEISGEGQLMQRIRSFFQFFSA